MKLYARAIHQMKAMNKGYNVVKRAKRCNNSSESDEPNKEVRTYLSLRETPIFTWRKHNDDSEINMLYTTRKPWSIATPSNLNTSCTMFLTEYVDKRRWTQSKCQIHIVAKTGFPRWNGQKYYFTFRRRMLQTASLQSMGPIRRLQVTQKAETWLCPVVAQTVAKPVFTGWNGQIHKCNFASSYSLPQTLKSTQYQSYGVFI